jgi:hypothetical protein
MAYQMANLRTEKETIPFEWKLPVISGGVNYEDLPWNCADNQSPKAINVWFNNRILSKRWGTKNLNTATGSPILSAYPKKFMGKFIFASGTSLYTFDTSTNTAAAIYTGMTANKGTFLKFMNKLYYINGAQYISYDGTTAKNALLDAYSPTVKTMSTPNGSGTINEDYNALGSGIKIQYVGDGTSTVYTLADQNLDATAVTASFDNGLTFNKVEGTNFSVNRTTGVVTFTTAPPTGLGRGNIVIWYYKTSHSVLTSILTCTQIIAFGGSDGAGNGTRIFYGANGTWFYYWSDVNNPTYIPVSQYNFMGTPDEIITGFGVQYNTLIVFKAKSTYGVTYSYDTTTAKAYFPELCINSAVGCDCPGTICLINDRLVFCNTYGGVYTLVYTNYVSLNLDLKPISRNINGNSRASGLLQEVNLANSVAIEFNRGYWLTVNNHVYYWDYGLTPYQNASDYEAAQKALSWWFLKDLPISCYMYDGANLYFGDNVSGYIVHFEETFADNGVGIDASWKLADRNFGTPEMRKTVVEEWISARSDTASTIGITHYSDRDPNGSADSKPIVINPSFSWSTMRWSTIFWGVAPAIQSFYRRCRRKNIKYYAIEFSNSTAGQDMNISDLRMNVSMDSIDRKG